MYLFSSVETVVCVWGGCAVCERGLCCVWGGCAVCERGLCCEMAALYSPIRKAALESLH